MEFTPIDLNFDGREAALARIKRYIHHITPIMFYRTNDLLHLRRVLWHLEEAIPDILDVYRNDFDVDFARTLAVVHDDVEILTGDVQLYDKEYMTREELEALAEEERTAIPRLSRMYGPIANGPDYEELLTAAKEKRRLKAKIVSFFDKFDGGGEAWHEVFAGNHHFLLPAGIHYGGRGGYVRRLNDFPNKYPEMAVFFERHPDYLPQPFSFTADTNKPHTEESLQRDTGYPPYEKWKRTIIKHEGIENLVKQVEFL